MTDVCVSHLSSSTLYMCMRVCVCVYVCVGGWGACAGPSMRGTDVWCGCGQRVVCGGSDTDILV